MTSLQTMIYSLEPLNIYRLDTDDDVTRELESYAYALDKHKENIQNVLDDRFIKTSSQSGIEQREKMFGYSREGFSLDDRREMLHKRLSLDITSHTVADFERFMNSLGVESYQLSEYPELSYISVMMFDTYTETLEKWLEKQIKEFLPAHCDVDVFFGGRRYNELDNLNRSFNTLDALNQSWAQIES